MAAKMKKEEPLKQEALLSIQKQYFQMVPIKSFDWKGIADHLDSTLQKTILMKTCMSNEFVKYTPSIKYKRMFLKRLMKISEEANYELVDELYECYAEVISKVDDDQSPCYKTYILPSGIGITLEESQNIISQGTTGLSTWQAALYMLEWALENGREFENRNIIELGCGLGLLGLSVCISCSPQHYVFTDCHEAVLEKLNQNLSINGYQKNENTKCHCKTEAKTVLVKCPCIKTNERLAGSHWSVELSRNETICGLKGFGDELRCSDSMTQDTSLNTFQEYECCGQLILPQHTDRKPHENIVEKKSMERVHLDQKDHHMTLSSDIIKVNVASLRLDWEEVDMDDLERLSCGVILATDVIYDIELINFFVPVVFKLLNCHGDGVSKPVAYVASTVRNPETFEYFLQQLVDYHIKWTELHKQSRKLFFYDDESDIRLMKLEV